MLAPSSIDIKLEPTPPASLLLQPQLTAREQAQLFAHQILGSARDRRAHIHSQRHRRVQPAYSMVILLSQPCLNWELRESVALGPVP